MDKQSNIAQTNKKAQYSRKSCRFCFADIYDDIEKCPRCDEVLITEDRIRKDGQLFIIVGIVLMVVMTLVVGLLLFFGFYRTESGHDNIRHISSDLVILAGVVFAMGMTAAGIFLFSVGIKQKASGRLFRSTGGYIVLLFTVSLALCTILLVLAGL